MLDLIVIGAGLSGMLAAHTAARAGARVAIVSKGLGALHWSAGTIDALGYFPDEKTPVSSPLAALPMLAPNHPYTLCDAPAAWREFAALTHACGLPYAGANADANLWLPSPAGAARPTWLAPRAQLAGDLARAEPMLIVGVRGMRDFFPELIAENLRKQNHAARAAFVPLEVITARHDSNSVQLAHALDDPARQLKLARELKKIVQRGERIGLPAILGLDNHPNAFQTLEAETGAAIFEIPTLPPSVPGIRLNDALRRELHRLGVRVDVNMDVRGFHADGARIAFVESETSGQPLKHRAEKFLLATGGILGGGIQSDPTGKTWEAVFDLPLTIAPNRGDWFRARFFDPAGHPIFRGGVAVNRVFQPVNAHGAPVYANLWAAGGVLAHADPILERSLEGVAIATGVAAGKFASQA